jgi:phosphoadenosine phosphosulfate reductase
VPLIASDRYTRRDLAVWGRLVEQDALWAQTDSFRRRVDRALVEIDTFARAGPCYAGVSWGKDSTVLADLVARAAPSVPLVCVVGRPIANPDCDLVRDAFRALHPAQEYAEIETWCRRDTDGWHATGTLERGFAETARCFGSRYLSGIRADESGRRKMRVRRLGTLGLDTAAPLGHWRARDVWAYLHLRALPIHPAYACSEGGARDRDWIRVAWLGLRHGRGRGRDEWERAYYAREMEALDRGEVP